MSQPSISIIFQQLAASAVRRSQRGVVALVIRDAKTGVKVYKGIEDVKSVDFSAENIKYIKEAFYGTPYRVAVVAIAEVDEISVALDQLKTMYFNYLAIPVATAQENTDIAMFIKGQRANKKKIFKAVLCDSPSDHESIINFTTTGIKKADGTDMTSGAFSVRLASVFAGLPFTRSATYYEFADIASFNAIDDEDEAVDSGELVLLNDGKRIKLGRAVNSLTTFTATKTKSFSKIRIMEILDMIFEDIRSTFENDYTGKYVNSFQNKLLLVSAINAYFATLATQYVLEKEAVNRADISLEQTKLYLQGKGKDTDELTDAQIIRANTESNVFLDARISPLDAMEDLTLIISF